MFSYVYRHAYIYLSVRITSAGGKQRPAGGAVGAARDLRDGCLHERQAAHARPPSECLSLFVFVFFSVSVSVCLCVSLSLSHYLSVSLSRSPSFPLRLPPLSLSLSLSLLLSLPRLRHGGLDERQKYHVRPKSVGPFSDTPYLRIFIIVILGLKLL